MTELKPCPFCGSEAKVSSLDSALYHGYYFIFSYHDGKCPLRFCEDVGAFLSVEQAIEAWNRRADDGKEVH